MTEYRPVEKYRHLPFRCFFQTPKPYWAIVTDKLSLSLFAYNKNDPLRADLWYRLVLIAISERQEKQLMAGAAIKGRFPATYCRPTMISENFTGVL